MLSTKRIPYSKMWLMDRVLPDKMQEVTEQLRQAAFTNDLFGVVTVVETKARAGNMELKLQAKLPDTIITRMILHILAEKSNPMPNIKAMPGGSVRAKAIKRKTTMEVPNTNIQEVFTRERVEANAAAIREILTPEGSNRQQQFEGAQRRSRTRQEAE